MAETARETVARLHAAGRTNARLEPAHTRYSITSVTARWGTEDFVGGASYRDRRAAMREIARLTREHPEATFTLVAEELPDSISFDLGSMRL